MFGNALRLMAAGEAGRRVGDYIQNLITKYLVLAVAGGAFSAAMVFVTLAGFWALNKRTNDWVDSAAIMAGILALIGFLIVFVAYGLTANNKAPSVSAAMRNPVDTVRANIPAVDDVGHQIETAVRQYGPLPVAAAAIGFGVVAGVMYKKYRNLVQ